jgi:hypothetical protein
MCGFRNGICVGLSALFSFDLVRSEIRFGVAFGFFFFSLFFFSYFWGGPFWPRM